ncbi:contactin-associated protein-like 4 [Daphnia pulex]|uniref:contactin-associated protein-like 4 n=1 Tax=Daphnia pulex TaxID=6669 RepID=UPI001EDC9A4C|nr:contactin-associated protein-like 4 [Daphnia pulex]
MSPVSVCTLIRSSVLVVLLWSTCSYCAVPTSEEKYAHLESKIAQLEARLDHFENVIKVKDHQHDILAENVSQLQLALQHERQTTSKLVTSINVNDRSNQLAVERTVARTCQEAILADSSLNSGMYWIDPDGQGYGDAPIYVYCDMSKGTTSISHDTESAMDVGNCAAEGCYSRAVNYNATSRQMSALADLSVECHQSIKYECSQAPFELNGITYSWWNDKNGNEKYFWAGMNTDGHTCQCGIDVNCVEASTKCNCDSAAAALQVDDGVVSDKFVLPVTRLNFGGTQNAAAVHTLGRFECSGKETVSGMPRSCLDLWRIGHILSGLHSVMGTNMVESVYCDFTKIPSDAGFQEWIGYVDVKSSPTYFYVQKTSNFDATNTPIPFEISKLNVGNAMNLASGKFTAPRAGTYYFSFSGLVSFPVTGSSEVYLGVELLLNGAAVGLGTTDEANTINSQLTPISLHSTLRLNSGDQIWLQINEISPQAYLYDKANWQSTHFTGWILEEELVN